MRLLLTQNLVYVPAHGGANKANRNLLESFAQRGHTCRAVVLATATQGSDTRSKFLEELARRNLPVLSSTPGVDVFECHGVEVHAAMNPPELLARTAEQIRSFDPDVTLVSHAGPALPLLEVVTESPCHFIYLAHTSLWLPFGPASFRHSRLETELLERASGIVAVSRFMKRYLKRWAGLDSLLLPLPIYGPGPFPVRGRFDEGFLTMVNPSSVKGISIFLDLARSRPDTRFAAVPTYRTTLTDRRALESLPNVRILEAVDDIDRIFSRTRVLLVPSLWDEAFGVIVVEAMLRGIPVLASDTGGLAEAKLGVDYLLPVSRIERYEPRFDDRHEPLAVIPPQDTSPWKKALAEILSGRERYERLSRESRRAALEFVASLSWKPLESFLENFPQRRGTAPAGGSSAVRSSTDNSANAHGDLGARVAALSPRRRSLLALWLHQENQKKNHRQTSAQSSAKVLEDRLSPLIAIEPRGSQRPFFCVHPAAGTVDCYVALAGHLAPDQPVYAFRAQGLDAARYAPHDSIEDMAVHYVETLRRKQARGPYFLGGWSFGAIVAFEMARQLYDREEPVALLALFDSLAPSPLAPSPQKDALLSETTRDATLDRLARELSQGRPFPPPARRATFVLEQLRRCNLVSPKAGLPELDLSLRVYAAHRRAILRYRPRGCPLPITLFRAEASAAPRATSAWWALDPRSVEVITVPGDHYTMFAEPHVGTLANLLRGCLARARAQVSRSR